MDKKTVNYKEYCERCQHYEYGKHRGVVCGLTHRRPTFKDECDKFLLDEERSQQIDVREKTKKMRKELKRWGIGLIILGIIHFVLSGYLSIVWGIFIIILGILNLIIMKRGMFIANGAALILIGILNAAGSVGQTSGGPPFWLIFGVMQIIWGVQEIIKYAKSSFK